MSKYYVKMGDLDVNGDGVISSAEKMLYYIENMKKSVENVEWTGFSAETYKTVVNSKIDKISKISGLYNAFGKFMKSTSSGFTNVNKEIEKMLGDLKNKKGLTCPKCGGKLVNGVCLNCNNSYNRI